MKKTIFIALALVGIALLGFTSCSKECTCTTYIDGKEISSVTFEKEKGTKCSDGNQKVLNTEIKCK
ncbi:MAG: hypothetical protein ACOX0V_10300 [Bacteroidales bacterium]|jgi:hypothetical protein